MEPKPWYKSKTLWTNIAALVTAAGAFMTGAADLPATMTAAGMALLNIILRFVTKQPID